MKKKTILTLLIAATTTAAAQVLPFRNTALPVEQRAEDLLSRLTLEEKVSLMMHSSPAIERLGVPQFEWWNEALHGVGRNGFSTVFPITTAMAASWDDALLQQVFDAVSDEARAKNQQAKRSGRIKQYQCLSFWTPNINIFRDPRWGRGQETYGEDPYLTARMGCAVVRGLQGPDDAKYRKLLACAKHFAVHSGPEWNRHTFNIEDLPERDLWETYLPAFKALVQEAGVEEVMCAYQRIDGEPCCANNRYEQQILRNEWGFKGLVTSDCWAVSDFLPGYHNVVEKADQATAIAVRAGTDLECGNAYGNLKDAVKNGWIDEATIDTSLRRLLIGRMKLGDFDPDDMVEWTKIPESVIASNEHKQMALQMAREGIVLLKNNGILPLSSGKARGGLVVMGPNANDSVMMWGNYSGYPTYTITALQGLRNLLGKNLKYIPGCGLTRSEVLESFYDRFTTPDGKRGLKGTYWNNEQLEGEAVAKVVYTEPIKLSNGGATVFAPGVQLEHFSARYEGTFKAEEDALLQLCLSADDKARVIVNGDTVINLWKPHRLQEANKELNVKAGKSYTFVIEYVQADDMAYMQFDINKKYTPTRQQVLQQIGAAQTVVFVGGISPRVEGEQMKVDEAGFKGGDRTSIELPQAQRDFLRMLHEAGKKVIFVNCSGGAVALTPEAEYCDAILQAWYGGEQGGQALAEILIGKTNPSGKLPMTFYKDDSQLPDFLDYRMKGRTYRYFEGEPLYPFGYGLSYTSFNISNPQYADGKVTLTLKNTGKRTGTETIQVYMRRTADTDGPKKTLRAYQRVGLKPGESKQVEISFPRERFETWDTQTNTMRVVPGEYQLMVGTSSADTDLHKFIVTQ